MGHGQVFLSVDLARTQLFWVHLGDGRSPFSLVTSGVPPKEGFQSRALGRGEWTNRTMVSSSH